MITRVFGYGVVLVAWVLAGRAGADPLPGPGAGGNASAADMVRKVRADEAWVDTVRSFRVVFENRWSKPPEAVERRRAELQAQFPRMEINEQKFPELRPERSGAFQIAFDEKRFHSWERDESREEMYFWDGHVHANMSADLITGRTNYGYASDPRGDALLLSMTWPRADHHQFWWSKSDERSRNRFATSFGDPEQWVLTGRQVFHGIDCHVLVRRHVNSERMYVGVADGMLHGMSIGTVIAPAKADAIAAEVAKAYGGDATTVKALYGWANKLKAGERDDVIAEFSLRRCKASFGFIEQWLLDYKEVAPGRWFPMTQGYIVYHAPGPNAKEGPREYDPASGREPQVDTRRDMRAVLVELDEPLSESLFSLGELKEGAEVFDTTKQPALSYKYKEGMTAEEWQRVLDRAAERDGMLGQMRRAQDAALHKPAPAFAAGGRWLNTDGPRTWESFKGKVVVVDLFAHWCGPCQNDYPTLVAVAGRRDPNLVVLGVHVASGAEDAGAIERLLKEFKITYPVYVDVDGGPDSMGKLAKALGVRGIPHTFVIGPDGNVAAHGTLGEALEVAQRVKREVSAPRPAKGE